MTWFGRGLFVFLVVLPLAFTHADERLKDIACRSVHLSYPAAAGVSFTNEITIKTSAPGTYFMVCGWDKGYFGLQELANGKKLILFSVWDSEQNDPKAVKAENRTKLVYQDEKVRIGRFGGEGTGGQSFFDYDWKVGTTYRLLVNARVIDKRTEYAGYFFIPESHEWKHLITFSTVTGGKSLSGYYSFIEDFQRDRISATKARAAHFSNGWVKTVSGEWLALNTARFTADANPVTNINALIDANQFFLATGGETKNTGTKLRQSLTLAARPDQKPPQDLPRADLHLLYGPWDQGTVHRESLLFLKGTQGQPAASLLYDADRVIAVHSADGKQTFEVAKDYQLSADGSALELTPGSRILSLRTSELLPPKGSPNSIGHRAGHPETNILFDNGHFFHDHQIEVTYVPRQPKWNAYRPGFAADSLPSTIAKLSKKQPVTIAVSGDSISEGYNASLFTKTAPFQPSFSSLVANQLEQTYGSKVTLHNFAVGGWSSVQGVKDLDKLLKVKPDLIIIAYGMNDVGGRNPEGFKANIATMLQRIKKADPATEVILVSTMTGNPDWVATPAEMFPTYRDALASLVRPGVVLADMTSVWIRLLERKHHTSLNGNGVNHPNDYGHRVYAQAILALLIDPTLIPKR